MAHQILNSKSGKTTALGAATTTGSGDSAVTTQRYVKDLVRVGEFRSEVDQAEAHEITLERIDAWVEKFYSMKAAGVKVPVPVTHTDDPEANRGWVTEMWRDGDTLFGVLELIGNDAVALANRSLVSIYAPEMTFSGDAKNPMEWEDAIAHVAIVTNPVVPSQGKFLPLAAGKRTGKDSEKNPRRAIVLARVTSEAPTMDWKKLAAALGMTPEEIAALTDATAEAAILAKIQSMTAKATADVSQAKAAAKAAEDALAAAKAGAAPQVDPDTLEDAADTIKASLDGLVAEGKITPATNSKLAASLIGEPGKRPAISLSRKAATAAGLAGPLAKAVVDALRDNDPVVLSKTAMSRGVAIPRKEENKPSTAVPDADLLKRAAGAYGAKK